MAGEEIEMIGISEFARRINVCPNTVRNWMETGLLRAGHHYLQAGKVYRFPWSEMFVNQLMKDLSSEPPPPRPKMKSRLGNRRNLKLKP